MSARRLLLAGVLAAASAVAGYAVYHGLARAPATEAAGLRPDFTLPDLQGRLRSVKEWDGKVLVLNFWATWCPPCLREIPTFVEMQRHHGGNGLQFVGIAIDNLKDVGRFATAHAINYPLLVSEQDGIALSRRLGNRQEVLPFTAVIDRRGRIAFTKLGEVSRAQAEKAIVPLL